MSATPKPVERKLEVPLLDLRAQYRALKTDILAAIESVCESQVFILGPGVRRLEEQVAAYGQARFGIGVSSGTDALLLALMALGIGPGDEVITSPYTFFATGGTIARIGARPIFVDIDPSTFNISPGEVSRFITKRCDLRDGRLVNATTGGTVRVLMPVHLYGQCADMDPLLAIAQQYSLVVVEDAAQAIGAEYRGRRRAGGMGEAGCFSFFPSKNLGAFGDAGLVTTQDADLAERLRVMRVHGGKPKYHHALIGGNFRIDELQAAVLNVKFAYLDEWTVARQRNAATYDQLFRQAGLHGKVVLPVAVDGYRHIYNQYVIRTPQRDALRQYLADCGVGSEIYYPVPLHLQPCFGYLGGKPGDCPEAERAARETIALPIYPELTPEQLKYVVDVISLFYD
jgi:dTDP-4-amino-4,6-dideoxygalactose transaminase